MSTEIYYFSGTGNSLFAAKELQNRIPDTRLIPIVSMLDKDVIKTEAKSVGFVFPVHALTIPIAVKRFLKKVDLESAEYVFAVATRLGTVFRGFEKIERMLGHQNKSLDSYFTLNMYSNDAREMKYKSPTEDDITKMECDVRDRLDNIQKIITNKRISREKDSGCLVNFPYNRLSNHLLEKFIISLMTVSEYIGGVNYFYTDEKCTGCGVCEKVCLSRKIKMKNKNPFWQKEVLCYMCYACVNFCPRQSVQVNDIPGVKSFTRNNGRYTHPFAEVEDIAGQKYIDS